jgi:hypothetical protein
MASSSVTVTELAEEDFSGGGVTGAEEGCDAGGETQAQIKIPTAPRINKRINGIRKSTVKSAYEQAGPHSIIKGLARQLLNFV